MKKVLQFLFLIFTVFVICKCSGLAASAEEYYTIGMAYFELGKYEEAENWLNRARSADRTMTASQYNLGRLAFEMQRYEEAADYFEEILKKDPDNILALKAAAYTRIKTGNIDIADRHYKRLLELVPESADDGYNHALVLFAMGRFSDSEEVLERYELQMLGNSEMQLLYARVLNAQNKAEALDSYASWLINNKDAKVRNEYAQILESGEYYARALAEYRLALSETAASGSFSTEIRFNIARVLLIAESESGEGITVLQAIVNEGFNDLSAIEELLADERISPVNKDSIRIIASNLKTDP